MRGIAKSASRGLPLLALALGLCGAALVHAAVSERAGEGAGDPLVKSSRQNGEWRPTGSGQPQRARKLELTGHVSGLYPGGTGSLAIQVSNPRATTVIVTSVQVRVRNAGPGCAARNLRIPGQRLRLAVAPHASSRTRLQVSMIADAPGACQGARFPLRFRAKAKAP